MNTPKITAAASTYDRVIRYALRQELTTELASYKLKSKCPADIIEELGVKNGAVRIDMAVVNGIMHGYEIKSDRDTLHRLPNQMNEYNKVFDKLTLVVGINHLHEAINLIPDWWGLKLAKISPNNDVIFYNIRDAEYNTIQNGISVARLLWREEALQILEDQNMAKGVRSKPREEIYKRLAEVVEIEFLKEKVRQTLLTSREDWRFGTKPASYGD